MSAAQPPAKPVTLGDLLAGYRQRSHLHDQGAGERPDWLDVINRPLSTLVHRPRYRGATSF